MQPAYHVHSLLHSIQLDHVSTCPLHTIQISDSATPLMVSKVEACIREMGCTSYLQNVALGQDCKSIDACRTTPLLLLQDRECILTNLSKPQITQLPQSTSNTLDIRRLGTQAKQCMLPVGEMPLCEGTGNHGVHGLTASSPSVEDLKNPASSSSSI